MGGNRPPVNGKAEIKAKTRTVEGGHLGNVGRGGRFRRTKEGWTFFPSRTSKSEEGRREERAKKIRRDAGQCKRTASHWWKTVTKGFHWCALVVREGKEVILCL